MECSSDRPIIDRLEVMIRNFRANPDSELEVRIGELVNNQFLAGVEDRYSLELHTAMTDPRCVSLWTVRPLIHFVYMHFPGDIRGTYQQGVKTRFHRINRQATFVVKCPTRKYALKFSLKEEIPLPDDTVIIEPSNFYKYNSRATLECDGWKYEFTKVGQGETSDVARQNISHQIELEMTHSQASLNDREMAISFLGKSRDMLDRYQRGDVAEVMGLEIC